MKRTDYARKYRPNLWAMIQADRAAWLMLLICTAYFTWRFTH